MRISILTFDAFNDLDSLVAFGMLSRIALLGDTDWQVRIASPTPRVTSMNGLTIDAHEDLSQLAQADAVLVGSGMKTREVANTPALMEQLRALNPERQLLAAQCSGTFLLSRLGLLRGTPACTDLTSKPWVVESGVDVVPRAFTARGNVATAGGCLASQYLVAWLIARLKGLDAAREVLHYFAPVGEKQEYIDRALAHVLPVLEPQAVAGLELRQPGPALDMPAVAGALPGTAQATHFAAGPRLRFDAQVGFAQVIAQLLAQALRGNFLLHQKRRPLRLGGGQLMAPEVGKQGVEQLAVVMGQLVVKVATGLERGVLQGTLAEAVDGEDRRLVEAMHRQQQTPMAGGEHEAIGWHGDFGPQHAWGVDQYHVFAKQ